MAGRSPKDVIRILGQFESTNRIVDILFLFNLLGDDFIPKINSINIINDYNLLFVFYISLGKKILRFESGVWKINSENLFEYLRLLSIDEVTRFNDNVKDFKQFATLNSSMLSKLDPSEKLPYKLNTLYVSEIFRKGYIVLKDKSATSEYQPNVFTVDSKGDMVINKPNYRSSNLIKQKLINTGDLEIVKAYLQGYQYILDLYFNGGSKNQYWYYEYHLTPTLTDVILEISNAVAKNATPTTVLEYLNKIFLSYETKPITVDSVFPFFTINEHDCFIKYHIEQFKNDHSVGNKRLKYTNIFNIYDCLNATYINKCFYKNMKNMTKPEVFLREIRTDPTNKKFSKCKTPIPVPVPVPVLEPVLVPVLEPTPVPVLEPIPVPESEPVLKQLDNILEKIQQLQVSK